MAHELMNDNAMFYVGKTPWHGLGYSLEIAPNTKDALKLAGLDWKVHKTETYIKTDNLSPNLTTKYFNYFNTKDNYYGTGYCCTYRMGSDLKPVILGHVSKKYEVLQNKDAFQPFDEVLLDHGYTYETEFQPIGDKPLPLKRLCKTIYQKAILKHSTEESWWICFKPKNTSNFLAFNTKENSGVIEKENVDDLEPRWEIHLDDRLLFLILSGYYHWANAEGGSHLYSKRIPNRYVEEIQTFLYFFII